MRKWHKGFSSRTCVYAIRNNVNGKIYIGSTVNLTKRWSEHKQSLIQQRHNNYHLQRAWNKYGEENFLIEIIEDCEIENLIEREQYWINYYRSYQKEFGYNARKNAATSFGHKLSDETKRKMSIAHKGRAPSPQTLQAATLAKLGKKRSDETRKKISEVKQKMYADGWRPSFVPRNNPRPPHIVREIREMAKSGMSFRAIGREKGMTHSTVSQMVKRIKPYDYE